MSDAAAVMAAPPRKKGGMKKMLMIGAGALVLLGGGAGAGMYAAGGGHKGPAEDPHAPKLVLREGEDAPTHLAPGAAIDPSKYKATYYTIEQPFTSNLRDSDGFMQLNIGVSTFYDAKVIDALKDNEIPVRSAILMTLADQDAFTLGTPEGKKALQKALAAAINDVLKAKTGYGGIDDVYFTNFIIQ